jgi:hypothetical protein
MMAPEDLEDLMESGPMRDHLFSGTACAKVL